MKIGIVLISTNSYLLLGLRFIKAFMKYYNGPSTIHFYVFSDEDPGKYMPNIKNYTYIHADHSDWAAGTNSKFTSIVSLKDSDCDHLYYFDSDTNIDKPFGDWFVGDLVAGEHYNNIDPKKPYDRNPNSKAYVPENTTLPQMYFYGAFYGGTRENMIRVSQIFLDNQREDKKIPYEPAWNDESYINQYFHNNPPSKVVAAKDFPFLVSDKGGITNTRNMGTSISEQLAQILTRPTEPFELKDGAVVFPTVPTTTGPTITAPIKGGRRKYKCTRRLRRLRNLKRKTKHVK